MRRLSAITFLTLLLTATFAAMLDPIALRANRQDKPSLSQSSAELESKDVLIIDDTRKYAYFGWNVLSQLPPTRPGQTSPLYSETIPVPNMTGTTIYVDPSAVDEDSPPLDIGHRFNVTVRVDNVFDLLEWAVQICFNCSILNATNAWIPKWDPEYVFYGTGYDVLPEIGFDCVWLTDSLYLLEEPTFEGNGTLAIVEFAVLTLPAESRCLASPLSINNTYTGLLNSDLMEIEADKIDGVYRSFGRPPVVWDLLKRTLTWTVSDNPPAETSIVFFTENGTSYPELDPDGKALYDKLVYWGYNATNITLMHKTSITFISSDYYDPFHVAIYASTDDYDSANVVNSSIPFITLAPGQTDEMGIGTGLTTGPDWQIDFYVASNNYYPTGDYPTGLLLLENETVFKATQAMDPGKVLVKAEQLSNVSWVLMSLVQDVYLLPDGSANMSFTLIAHSSSPSPLADAYREAFFAEPEQCEPEVEYEIPENKTVEQSLELEEGVKDLSLVGDITGPEGVPDGIVNMLDLYAVAMIYGASYPDPKYKFDYDIVYDTIIDMRDLYTIAINYGQTQTQQSSSQQLGLQQTSSESPEPVEPVRELFHMGISIEQSVLLGFEINITESRIVPWGSNNETQLLISAYSVQLATPVNDSSWQVSVGPQDNDSVQAASEYMMTKIQQIQTLLRSWEGEQTLEYNGTMRIHLPPEAELLNAEERHWNITFGGGTEMYANLASSPTVVTVYENMYVTEQDITASDTYLNEAFGEYRVFAIYFLSPVPNLSQASIEQVHNVYEDFSKNWGVTISLPCSKTFSYGPLQATLRVTPSLSINGYIGWHFKWFKLQWFETWMSVSPSITAEAIVTAAASYSKTWSQTLVTWSYRFSFWVGAVPVWANLRLTITAGITVNAKAQVSVTASVSAGAWMKAGVKWNRNSGWSTIWGSGTYTSLKGPSVAGSASVTVTPYVAARLAFLIYDVAGPFVEAKPYAPMTITYSYPGPSTWSIALKLKVSVGVTFAGWLQKILKLSGYSRTVADWTLKSWSGNW